MKVSKLNKSCCPTGLFCCMHRFTIYTCGTKPQFNDSLMTQFNRGKGYEGTNHRHSPTVTPVIDFTDEPVIQCVVLVVEKTFADIANK